MKTGTEPKKSTMDLWDKIVWLGLILFFVSLILVNIEHSQKKQATSKNMSEADELREGLRRQQQEINELKRKQQLAPLLFH